ncbi:hypothetical protein DMUE_1317 [Dictyocoela muelleri]|nr:hypothetical protein DMUE_1317 [Dictyocoela muelleri]
MADKIKSNLLIKKLKTYKLFVKKSSKLLINRNKIIKNHLYTSENQNKEQKIKKIIDKYPSRPSIYLASSLGFNKLSFNKDVEIILNKFGLEMKLKSGSFKNYDRFEILKLLINKVYEKRK